MRLKDFILDLLFPQFCISCQREGSVLCPDCLSTIEVTEILFCPFCSKPNPIMKCKKHLPKSLDGLFSAVEDNQPLTQKMIKNLPGLKILARPLASLIIAHIFLSENKSIFQLGENSGLLALPVSLKERKKMGFNRNEEIAKELSRFFKIKVIKKYSDEKRIFLVTDVYSKETDMEEMAVLLKEQGAESVFGVVVTRVAGK